MLLLIVEDAPFSAYLKTRVPVDLPSTVAATRRGFAVVAFERIVRPEPEVALTLPATGSAR